MQQPEASWFFESCVEGLKELNTRLGNLRPRHQLGKIRLVVRSGWASLQNYACGGTSWARHHHCRTQTFGKRWRTGLPHHGAVGTSGSWPFILPLLGWACDGHPLTSILSDVPTHIFYKTQGGRSRLKWHSKSDAKMGREFDDIILGNKKWKSCHKVSAWASLMSLARFEDRRLYRWAKADTLPTSMESSHLMLTVFCSSRACFQRWSQYVVPERIFSATKAICFPHSVFVLKGCIVVKYFASHFKQQLGIQTWFRIQSHVVSPMQIAQMGWKSDEQTVSTPG